MTRIQNPGGGGSISTDIVTLTGTQTLTNKTITTPVIESFYQDSGKTKLMTTPNTASDTLCAIAATQTLTNKTLTSPKLNEAVELTSTSTELNALDGQTGAWTSWTPTLGNITKGSGSTTSVYVKVGRVVTFYFRFNMAADSSMGTGPYITLPVNAARTHAVFLPIWIWDAGSAYYTGFAINDGGNTNLVFYVSKADGTYTNIATEISATVPMTWTTNDAIVVTGSYESGS